MNKRIAKAKTTNKVEPKSATKTVESSTQKTKKEAKEYTLYIQYQNREYNMADLTKQILEKCGAEKMDPADLRIYVKPEDGKAYYVCAGGSSSVAL